MDDAAPTAPAAATPDPSDGDAPAPPPLGIWRRDAACADHEPEMWFPGRGQDARPARAICGECLVSADCLAYAMDNAIKHGMWGGLSERQRRKLRRTWQGQTS